MNQSPGEGQGTTHSRDCKEGQRTGIQEAGAWGVRGGRGANAIGAKPCLVLSQQQRGAFRGSWGRAGQMFLESIFVTAVGEHLGPDGTRLEQLSRNKSRTVRVCAESWLLSDFNGRGKGSIWLGKIFRRLGRY